MPAMGNPDPTPPPRQIRAVHDEDTITVYQAYSPAIAGPAVEAGRFVPPFKLERMTWIKPSFRWMMYRCGWATKPGQERVLAIRLTRAGFERALSLACLSHFDPAVHRDRDTWRRLTTESPVRVQWDPERDAGLRPLPWRSIQIGLRGPAVHEYVNEWTVDLTDITDDLRRTPDERPYPLPEPIAARIGASP